jgi:hypothetical protein
MSGFPFTPIISFICSFFILSILVFLADLLNTPISVDKILFISLVGICRTECTYLHTKINQLGDNTTEIKHRISQTRKAINALGTKILLKTEN